MHPLHTNETSADYPWLGHSLTKAAEQRFETDDTPPDPQSFSKRPSVLLKPNFHPSHYFDYIFGAGTGGYVFGNHPRNPDATLLTFPNSLAAIALGRMHVSINEALEQLDILGNEVFGKWSAAKEVPRIMTQPYVGVTDISLFGTDMMHEYALNTLEKALENIIGDYKDIGVNHLCLDVKEQSFRSDSKKCRT